MFVKICVFWTKTNKPSDLKEQYSIFWVCLLAVLRHKKKKKDFVKEWRIKYFELVFTVSTDFY